MERGGKEHDGVGEEYCTVSNHFAKLRKWGVEEWSVKLEGHRAKCRQPGVQGWVWTRLHGGSV